VPVTGLGLTGFFGRRKGPPWCGRSFSSRPRGRRHGGDSSNEIGDGPEAGHRDDALMGNRSNTISHCSAMAACAANNVRSDLQGEAASPGRRIRGRARRGRSATHFFRGALVNRGPGGWPTTLSPILTTFATDRGAGRRNSMWKPSFAVDRRHGRRRTQ